VHEATCRRLARFIASKHIPVEREEIELQEFSDLEKGNLLLFIVSICHRTSTSDGVLSGNVGGTFLKGWDFLFQRFIEFSRDHRTWLKPVSWAQMTEKDMRQIYPVGSGLTDIGRRIELLNDLGSKMLKKQWYWLQDIYDACNGWILREEAHMLGKLSLFQAYSDPVHKKSFFLLSLMRTLTEWDYQDPENLGPPVDYHEVRGHLRLGTVRVEDTSLKKRLLLSIPVTQEEDIAIRAEVFKAIVLISELSGLSDSSRLHYAFWNLFRNFCTRLEPNCFGSRRESYLPDRYRELISCKGKDFLPCPFNTICQSADSLEKYQEHRYITDYY